MKKGILIFNCLVLFNMILSVKATDDKYNQALSPEKTIGSAQQAKEIKASKSNKSPVLSPNPARLRNFNKTEQLKTSFVSKDEDK